MATDNFTNSNGTLLTNHDAKWDAVNGSNTDNAEINGNELRVGGIWSECHAMYTNSQPADQESQGVAKATSALRFDSVRIGVRKGTTTEGYDVYFHDGSGANYTSLRILKNGSWFATLTNAGSWAYASDHTLKIGASGGATTTLKGYVDGTQIGGDQTDSSSPITSGTPGFTMAGGGTQEAHLDDWTDNIAAGGGLSIPVAMNQYRQRWG